MKSSWRILGEKAHELLHTHYTPREKFKYNKKGLCNSPFYSLE